MLKSGYIGQISLLLGKNKGRNMLGGKSPLPGVSEGWMTDQADIQKGAIQEGEPLVRDCCSGLFEESHAEQSSAKSGARSFSTTALKPLGIQTLGALLRKSTRK